MSYALLPSYLRRHRPTTRSNSERTSTSRNLSQKHIIAYKRAAEITARYDGFPAIVSSAKRCVTSQDEGDASGRSSTEDSLQVQPASLNQDANRIRRCVSENGRLLVRGTSFKRAFSGVYYRKHNETNYFNVNAAWPALCREDSACVGTTDLGKLYAELRMTVKLSPLPVLGLKSLRQYR